jgi:hypothetical protein
MRLSEGLGDADTVDLFSELSLADQQLWLFEAHLDG